MIFDNKQSSLSPHLFLEVYLFEIKALQRTVEKSEMYRKWKNVDTFIS